MGFHPLAACLGEVNKLVAMVRRRHVEMTYSEGRPLWLCCVRLWLVGRSVDGFVVCEGDGRRRCMQEKRG